MMDMSAAQSGRPARRSSVRRALSAALPFLILLVIGLALPLFAGGYWGVIATRACVYWVLVAGLNLLVGFAGQLAIGWVALLTLGAYTTSVLAAGNVMPALASLSGARDRRRGRRGVRRDRRPAGAAAAHLLFRDHDARLCHHRHADRARLGERHRRRRRRARARSSRRRSIPNGASTISASASRRSAPG